MIWTYLVIIVLEAPSEYCLFSWCSLLVAVVFGLLLYQLCVLCPGCDATVSDCVCVMLTEGQLDSSPRRAHYVTT